MSGFYKRKKKDMLYQLSDYYTSLQMTMITTYGVKKDKYSNLIQSQVTLDDLFHE